MQKYKEHEKSRKHVTPKRYNFPATQCIATEYCDLTGKERIQDCYFEEIQWTTRKPSSKMGGGDPAKQLND